MTRFPRVSNLSVVLHNISPQSLSICILSKKMSSGLSRTSLFSIIPNCSHLFPDVLSKQILLYFFFECVENYCAKNFSI